MSVDTANTARRGIWLGTLLVATAACGFGLVGYFAKLSYDNGLTPEGALIWRYGLPALVFAWFLPRAFAAPRAAIEMFATSLVLGVAMVGLFNGFKHLDIAIVILIFFMHPLFAILFASLFTRTRPSGREIIAALLILAAAAVILEPARITGEPWVIAYTFAPPVAYGLLIAVLSLRVHGLDPLGKIAASYCGISLVAIAIALANGLEVMVPQTPTGWFAAVALITLSGVLPQLGLMFGAPLLGPGRTAITGTLELIVALAAGWVLLSEPVHMREIIGAVMVFAAVILAARPARISGAAVIEDDKQ